MSEPRLLLCTDMDRTVIPNGQAPESPEARPRLRALCRCPEVTLVYVSGRNRELVKQAITEYDLPQPDFVVSDVGTIIYRVTGDNWSEWSEWTDALSSHWPADAEARIEDILPREIPVTRQEPERQNRCKISYYLSARENREALARARDGLAAGGLRAELIFSVDEDGRTGLLDVVPPGGTKRHAVEFLCRELQFAPDAVVFGGDSGNDLPMAESTVPFVVVANATDEIKAEACRRAMEHGQRSSLYVAEGGRLNMNGNYAAGLLEGVWHFVPSFRAALEHWEMST